LGVGGKPVMVFYHRFAEEGYWREGRFIKAPFCFVLWVGE
jgi:hypothetical protein